MSVKQPNILFVTTDQQRFDTCGPRAPEFMRTPHFDVLCHEGVRFDSAYADAPICVGARCSMMTGQYVTTHGMDRNGVTSEVLDDERTMPSLLRQAGYQTWAAGKMHFGPARARHGFDDILIPDDYYDEMAKSGTNVQPMRHGLGQNEMYPGMSTVSESQTLTSWIAEQCVDFIRNRRDSTRPFFLWCSFSKPHPPLDPPEPYYSMYRNCDIPEPVCGDWSEEESTYPYAMRRFHKTWSADLIPPGIIREARAAYYGLITQCDYNMGRVFAALQDAGLFSDTLILYTSDHGELLGDHHGVSKIFAHEGSAHVPMALRLPKSWEDRCHGTSVSHATTHADILPTFLSAAGVDIPDYLDGQDLIALARGEVEEPQRYIEITERYGEYWAITDGRWKYSYFREGPCEQLFDLQTDPHELKNLAGLRPYSEKQAELKDEMIRRHTERKSDLITEEGILLTEPVRKDSDEDLRNWPHPGYQTEQNESDTKH